VKFGEEVVEIVQAFDLTGSYRDAAELVGCSPTTVARYVALRGVGLVREHAGEHPLGWAAWREPRARSRTPPL
jgi:hypothetical protein